MDGGRVGGGGDATALRVVVGRRVEVARGRDGDELMTWRGLDEMKEVDMCCVVFLFWNSLFSSLGEKMDDGE